MSSLLSLHFHYHSHKAAKVAFTDDQLRDVFKKYDANGDNRLSEDEIKEAFKYLGSLWASWRAMRGLQYADSDGDGYVSEGELKALVNYASKLGYTVG